MPERTDLAVGSDDIARIDREVQRLEAQLRGATTSDPLAPLAIVEGLGPHAPAQTKAWVRELALQPPSDLPLEIQGRALLASLLSGTPTPEIAAARKAATRGAAPSSDGSANGAAEATWLELLGALELRSPPSAPHDRNDDDLAQRAAFALQRLEFDVRTPGDMTGDEWQLARAVFRTLPQVQDDNLRLRALRLFDKLRGIADDSNVPSHRRLETLTAGVMALSPGSSAARQLVLQQSTKLLHDPDQSGVASGSGHAVNAETLSAWGAALRALRATRTILTQTPPAPTDNPLFDIPPR